MLQRAFYLLHGVLEIDSLFRMVQSEMIAEMERAAGTGPAGELLTGLFGPARLLYKRLAQYSLCENPELFSRLARRPYPWLVACAEQLAAIASTAIGRVVAPHELLFDAPPVQREVEIDVEIYYRKERRYRPLEEVSPVVRALAREQFDDYVKRVRIFAHPRIAPALLSRPDLGEMIHAAIDRTQ
jgi:hypothetical protein